MIPAQAPLQTRSTATLVLPLPSALVSLQTPAPALDTEPVYSIRMVEPPETRCTRCDSVAGSGPVGYCADRPLCDGCLLECSPQLGMVLALVAAARHYASSRSKDPQELQERLAELGAFARLYGLFAAAAGPPRVPRGF